MKKSRSPLKIVLIGSGFAAVGALAGCGADDKPLDMERKGYASLQDCVADWGNPSDCQTGSGSRVPNTSHGAYPYFWGPYYSQAGRVYHYDGRTSERPPGVISRGIATESATQSPSAVRGSIPGKVPTSRGGFGSSGRASSGYSGGG